MEAANRMKNTNGKNDVKKDGSMPSNVLLLDAHGKLLRKVLPSGLDKFSMHDVAWQAVHVAAAGACTALSTAKNPAGIHSVVRIRNAQDRKSCRQICGDSWTPKCEGEVSLWGASGKGKKNGAEVANFYSYGCDYNMLGGSEVNATNDDIFREAKDAHLYIFSYCCCSFPGNGK